MPTRQPDFEPVALIRRVEELVGEIELAREVGDTIEALATAIIDRFGEQLGLRGGRLYRRRRGAYEPVEVFGEARPVPVGVVVPAGYAPVEALLEQRALFLTPGDPSLDAELEQRLGAAEFAAITVGGDEWILAFDVAPQADRDRILLSLGILRHAIEGRLHSERFESVLREARRIQASILPRQMPSCPGFDIYGCSQPLHSVGGDHFDFIEVTEKIVGIAIADVTGHGLPAALQVRDIHTGLRMGLSRDLKIVRVVEMLNRLIHQSTLTSRFVSLFYGELEPNGIFIYVNAGHPPPVVLRVDGRERRLSEGGAVLGPIADTAYERGFVRLRPGDLMLLYTDGLVEAPVGDGAEYGEARLLDCVRRHRRGSAQEVVEAALADVAAAGGGRRRHDDRTLLVVKAVA